MSAKVLGAFVAALICAATATAAHGETLLKLDGVGPVTLHMKRSSAVDSGWVGDRGSGCELGGPPRPITYRFTGDEAPDGLQGNTEFANDRLTYMTFTGGVRTKTAVRIGTTVSKMLSRYRRAGYKVKSQYIDTFGGTFVYVYRRGRQVIGGFAEGGHKITMLGIPLIPLCE